MKRMFDLQLPCLSDINMIQWKCTVTLLIQSFECYAYNLHLNSYSYYLNFFPFFKQIRLHIYFKNVLRIYSKLLTVEKIFKSVNILPIIFNQILQTVALPRYLCANFTSCGPENNAIQWHAVIPTTVVTIDFCLFGTDNPIGCLLSYGLNSVVLPTWVPLRC